jgi:response regulator RpfG family c-di-GMP phosphodiesterase
MAAYHHEKWDGSGYPEGLKGEVIPLSARIMAVADVFDALTAKRVYKDPMPFEKAMDIIVKESGKHFDPKCVEVFVESEKEVRRVLKKYQE